MKKIITYLFVFITIVSTSCKGDKEKKSETKIKNSQSTCTEDVTDAINNPGNVNNTAIASALKKCGGFICNDESLLKMVESIHNKDKTEFENLKKAYWGNNKIDYKIFKWGEINDLANGYCYEEYLAFDFDGNINTSAQDIKISLVSDFTTSPTCYSAALFKSILANYPAIKDDTEFKFTKAIINGKISVVFEINDAKINIHATYDMSQIPTFNPSPLKIFLEEVLKSLNK